MSKKLLIVDDDKILTDTIVDLYTNHGFQIRVAHTVSEGMALFLSHAPELVLLDQELPDGDGVSLCRRFLEIRPDVKIIFITAYPTYRYAVEATKLGAFDYITKPFDPNELFITTRNALAHHDLERFKDIQDYRNTRELVRAKLVGTSPAAVEMRRHIAFAASNDAPVLITGETGVGKNMVARLIHSLRTPKETLLTINCAAIPEHLIESELFGHERGAFTGATGIRKGIFELTTNGTLILDEIGEMPYHLQSKLLNVLEEKKVRRIGGTIEIGVDVKVIALTNMEIEQAMEKKQFRRDLYYRLSTLRIHLPPLRERREDIEELYKVITQALNFSTIPLQHYQIDRMKAYDWPGNVRELRNIIERAFLLMRQGEPFQPERLLRPESFDKISLAPPPGSDVDKIPTLQEVERQAILATLRHFQGKKSPAARALGISLNRLKRKLQAIGHDKGMDD